MSLLWMGVGWSWDEQVWTGLQWSPPDVTIRGWIRPLGKYILSMLPISWCMWCTYPPPPPCGQNEQTPLNTLPSRNFVGWRKWSNLNHQVHWATKRTEMLETFIYQTNLHWNTLQCFFYTLDCCLSLHLSSQTLLMACFRRHQGLSG